MQTKTIKRAYKYRLYPTPEQEHTLHRTWGCTRLTYNKALEHRTNQWYKHHQRTTYNDTSKLLTQWRNSTEHQYLQEVSYVPLQQGLRNLQKAFNNFWSKRASYPKYKTKHGTPLSLEYTKSGFRTKNGQIYIAKTQDPLNIIWSRPLDLTNVTTITIKQDTAQRWFITLLTEETVLPKPKTGKTVGIDLGVKDALVLSDGRKFNPSDAFNLKQKQARIRKRQQELSRKAKGSNNRDKARLKLSRAHAKLTDAKRDWLHKTTSKLVTEYDVLCIEDLNVAGMTRAVRGKGRSAKSGLNRGILSNNFGEFRMMLEYKGDWYGKSVVPINRFYPSSKRCSVCGVVWSDLGLGDRVWSCVCGVQHDRDVNAARNVLAAGLAVLACGDSVRLDS